MTSEELQEELQEHTSPFMEKKKTYRVRARPP